MRRILSALLVCVAATCCGQEIEWGGNPIRVYDVAKFSVTAPGPEGAAFIWIAQTDLEIVENDRTATITGPNGDHEILLRVIWAELDSEGRPLLKQKRYVGRFRFAYGTVPPDDDDDDDEPPPNDTFGLLTVTRNSLKKLSDGAKQHVEQTRRNFDGYVALIASGQYDSKPLRSSMQSIASAIASANQSTWGTWRGEWGVAFVQPVEAAFTKADSEGKIKTIRDYGSGLSAIVKGLE